MCEMCNMCWSGKGKIMCIAGEKWLDFDKKRKQVKTTVWSKWKQPGQRKNEDHMICFQG